MLFPANSKEVVESKSFTGSGSVTRDSLNPKRRGRNEREFHAESVVQRESARGHRVPERIACYHQLRGTITDRFVIREFTSKRPEG